jgi:hypothetical protein
VHHREADDQITHAERAEGNDRALQRDDRPRAAKGGSVGELQQAAGDGRVGLDQLHQVGTRKIIPLQQLDDREGNTLGRRQLARSPSSNA